MSYVNEPLEIIKKYFKVYRVQAVLPWPSWSDIKDDLKDSKSLKRALRRKGYYVTFRGSYEIGGKSVNIPVKDEDTVVHVRIPLYPNYEVFAEGLEVEITRDRRILLILKGLMNIESVRKFDKLINELKNRGYEVDF